MTRDAGLTTTPALSADGALVAYASDRAEPGTLDIWVRQLTGGGAVRLDAHPAADRSPTFSPDGSRLAFRSERDGGGVYVVPTLGGEPRRAVQGGRRPR